MKPAYATRRDAWETRLLLAFAALVMLAAFGATRAFQGAVDLYFNPTPTMTLEDQEFCPANATPRSREACDHRVIVVGADSPA